VGAKKEGTVTVYTSANVDDMAVVTALSRKNTAQGAGVARQLRKCRPAQASRRPAAADMTWDVIETGGAAMESLHRETCSRR